MLNIIITVRNSVLPLLFSVMLSGCMVFQQVRPDIQESKNYLLHESKKASVGTALLRESRIAYLSVFVALQDVEIPWAKLYSIKSIRRGMFFLAVKQKSDRFYLWNSEFDPQSLFTVEVLKDGTLTSKKPLYSTVSLANLDRRSQGEWKIANLKLFERLTQAGSFDYELVYAGASDVFFYFRYRERIPGSSEFSYQEILKFPLTSKSIEINGKNIQILGVTPEEIRFAVTAEKPFEGFAVFDESNIVSSFDWRQDVNHPIDEMGEADNPKEALLRWLVLLNENYYGLAYDRMDDYSKGRADAVADARGEKNPELFRGLSPRFRYIHMAKPWLSIENSKIEFHEKDLGEAKNENGKARIEVTDSAGKIEYFYLFREDNQWRVRLGDNLKA